MINIGILAFKRCRKCGKRFVRWESREDLYDGLILTVRSPILGRGLCYPCFTVENLKLDVEIAKADRGWGGRAMTPEPEERKTITRRQYDLLVANDGFVAWDGLEPALPKPMEHNTELVLDGDCPHCGGLVQLIWVSGEWFWLTDGNWVDGTHALRSTDDILDFVDAALTGRDKLSKSELLRQLELFLKREPLIEGHRREKERST